jgi:hypothetical protein
MTVSLTYHTTQKNMQIVLLICDKGEGRRKNVLLMFIMFIEMPFSLNEQDYPFLIFD